MELKNNLDYALAYVALGWEVFPIRPKTKKFFYPYPEYKGAPNDKYPEGTPYSWKAQATKDPERVKRYWMDHPDASIGVATGQRSGGLFVIDFDQREEEGKFGLETLREWEREHGELPETARILSGGGGLHLLYMYDKPIKGGSDIREGMDIRGEGNYIIAPPSVHPNGNRYEWEAGFEPFKE